MERIRESVLPSGVQFSVRNLIGDDQELLTKANKKGETSQSTFNKMLAGAMKTLGNKEGDVTPNDIASMLSNDRKFALIVLRQHTLEYKESFEFKYEFPLQPGEKKKEVIDYSVSFNHENFPVVPYKWMREKIAELQKDDKDFKPDGHLVPFPVMFTGYGDMIALHKEVNSKLKDGRQLKWDLLDGHKELLYANTEMSMNLMLAMRNPRTLFIAQKDTQNDTWSKFETGKEDTLILEDFRFEIFDMEGSIDTSLVITHPTNRNEIRVDLVRLPAFFFPSLAR